LEEGGYMEVECPIPMEDVLAIQGLVANLDPLITPIDGPSELICNFATYLAEHELHGTAITLVPDRNILSHLVAIGRGEPTSEPRRNAAAVLAFCQCANIMIEPNLALYELAHSAGSDSAQ